MKKHHPDEPASFDDAAHGRVEAVRIRGLFGLETRWATDDERLVARSLDRIERMVAARLRRRRRRGAVLGTLAAVLVLVVGVTLVRPSPAAATVPVLHYSGLSPLAMLAGERDDPAATLDELAAATQDLRTPGTGDVQAIETHSWNLVVADGEVGILPTHVTMWVATDGSWLTHQTASPELTIEGRLATEPLTAAQEVVQESGGPGGVAATLATDLPRDPDGLRQALRDLEPGECGTEATCLFTAVSFLSTNTVLPPDLTAAIWQALQGVDGISSLGTTTDRLGREALAIAAGPFDTPAGSTVIVLQADPGTGAITGVEWVGQETPDGEPRVDTFTAVAFSGYVEALGATPPTGTAGTAG